MTGLPPASEPVKLLDARCSMLLALHHEVGMLIDAPAARTMPSPVGALTLTPSKKFSRSLSVTVDPPVFVSR